MVQVTKREFSHCGSVQFAICIRQIFIQRPNLLDIIIWIECPVNVCPGQPSAVAECCNTVYVGSHRNKMGIVCCTIRARPVESGGHGIKRIQIHCVHIREVLMASYRIPTGKEIVRLRAHHGHNVYLGVLR